MLRYSQGLARIRALSLGKLRFGTLGQSKGTAEAVYNQANRALHSSGSSLINMSYRASLGIVLSVS